MPEANGRPHHDSDELGSQRHVQEDNGAFQDAFSSQANFSSAQNELISSGQNEGEYRTKVLRRCIRGEEGGGGGGARR